MLSPKIAKAPTKATDSPTRGLAHQPSALGARPLGGGAIEQAQMLQSTIGNQATLRYLTHRLSNLPANGPAEPLPGAIQAKLAVGQVNDPLEHEADRVADQVMRMSDPVPSIATAPPQISRKCTACEEVEKSTLQTKSAETAEAVDGTPPIVHEVLGSPGQPLAPEDLAFFGPRFGFDFSHVRIHTDRVAAESAHAVNALAYASGADIAFAAGHYQPGSETGRHLLAHELAHVVQQSSGDRGYLRRLGDPSKVPAVLSCAIPSSNVPPNHEFVLFPNRGTSLNDAQKVQVGNYSDRYHESGSSGAVRVDGFASEPGDDSLNWQLSCDRASAVKDELVHPSAATHPGLPENSINVFMQGETAEFGAQDQNRRATLFPRIESRQGQPSEGTGTPTPQDTTPSTTGGGGSGGTPTDAGQGQPVPQARPSCAVNSDCPDDYCLPFPTRQEALADRTRDGESILSTVASANSRAAALFRRYVFNPGPAGDISTEHASDFTSSLNTRNVSEQIHPLVQADIQSHPPAFPAGGWATVNYDTDPSKDALKQQFNRLATDGLVFTDPFEVPGLIAGGVSRGQSSCNVGANTSGAQEDGRSARVTAEVFRNPDGTFVINPIVNYTVVDTIDFCPGNCGGFFAQHLGGTVQMSRWEASGISGDVPFTVNFPGPSLIGAYDSED